MTIPTTTGTGPAPDALATAVIIPFPTRPVAKPAAVPDPDGDRLARALAALNAALADQRAALTAWRSVLGELKTSTSTLEDSLQRYRGNLRSLGTSVSALREKSKALEQWADGVIASEGQK